MMKEILIDTSLDVLKMLPYLFAAFMLIEVLEKYSGAFTEKILLKVGRAGPVAGALLGCIPQCGFCVVAANLYTGGIISTGTLLSVFIATSDEAVLILLGNPDAVAAIGPLLAAKVVIAVLAGYLTDLLDNSPQGERKPAQGVGDAWGRSHGRDWDRQGGMETYGRDSCISVYIYRCAESWSRIIRD